VVGADGHDERDSAARYPAGLRRRARFIVASVSPGHVANKCKDIARQTLENMGLCVAPRPSAACCITQPEKSRSPGSFPVLRVWREVADAVNRFCIEPLQQRDQQIHHLVSRGDS
jgi:hypothetical protein